MKDFIPFSNGTEAMMWQEMNCFKCESYESDSQDEDEAKCKLAFNIDIGLFLGTIPENIVDDIGFTNKSTQWNEYRNEDNHFCKLCSKCNKFKPLEP